MMGTGAGRRPARADALAAGTCANPFSVLGRHAPVEAGLPAVMVRTIQPRASSVELVADGRAIPMTRRWRPACSKPRCRGTATPHELAYRLRVHEGAAVRDLVDPYQFGPVLTDFDLHLFAEGTHYRAWEQLGARRLTIGDVTGVHFAVWAPNAQRVSVVGDFNHWDGRVHPMRRLMPSGIWELFVPDLGNGTRYKYEVRTPGGHLLEKADPFARAAEAPPQTASLVWTEDGYAWDDGAWMSARARPAAGWIGRCRSTKCTSARGGATTTAAACRIASWPIRWCRMPSRWATRTSS